MAGHFLEIAILLALILTVVWAIRQIAQKAKRGGGCCGEHEPLKKGITVRDKKKSHYPYAVDLKVRGMTCSNCAKRVENALNALDGTWASVDKNTDTAHILLKQEADIPLLCATVAKAGYMAEQK